MSSVCPLSHGPQNQIPLRFHETPQLPSEAAFAFRAAVSLGYGFSVCDEELWRVPAISVTLVSNLSTYAVLVV